VAIGLGRRRKGQNIVPAMARRLRRNEKCPIIGRISDDALLLDPRCVLPEEDPIVVPALRDLAVESI